jgi:hypothetical protein
MLREEAFLAKLLPEGRDRWLRERLDVLGELADALRALEHGRDGGMGRDKLDRRCRQRDAVLRADAFHAADPLDDCGRRRLVVEDLRVPSAAKGDNF